MAMGSRERMVAEAKKRRIEERDAIRETLGRPDRTVAVEFLLI